MKNATLQDDVAETAGRGPRILTKCVFIQHQEPPVFSIFPPQHKPSHPAESRRDGIRLSSRHDVCNSSSGARYKKYIKMIARPTLSKTARKSWGRIGPPSDQRCRKPADPISRTDKRKTTATAVRQIPVRLSLNKQKIANRTYRSFSIHANAGVVIPKSPEQQTKQARRRFIDIVGARITQSRHRIRDPHPNLIAVPQQMFGKSKKGGPLRTDPVDRFALSPGAQQMNVSKKSAAHSGHENKTKGRRG